MDPVAPLPIKVAELFDLTDTLRLETKRWAGNGSFGTVFSCSCKKGGTVAIKAINFPRTFPQAEKEEFLRKMRRELGVWKRLYHPNIVPLLGKASGAEFASDHSCMVSMWMPSGTLAEYLKEHEKSLSPPKRSRLIQGTAAGLEHLHSASIIHGDFHPGNILIDSDHNPRVTDFGYSQTLSRQDQLTYLWTESIRPGAKGWVAPELLRPDLYPNLKDKHTLKGDIYSLGCIILFILSGNPPWKNEDFGQEIEQLNSPPRQPWPVLPDAVWNFMEKCWSPKSPESRPSARDVRKFFQHRLEQLLQASHASGINVVLFGAVGCGKSSLINLLAGEPIAPVSTSLEPCTNQPRCYEVPRKDRTFTLWDTMGFSLPRGGAIDPNLPHRQAHTLLSNLPGGSHLIILCADRDEIRANCPGLRDLYHLINDVFFGGRAPIALVVTHFDTPETVKKWWEDNQGTLSSKTNIPVSCIPHACTTTAPSGCDEAKRELWSLLEKSAGSAVPVPLRDDLSSQEVLSLVDKLGFTSSDTGKSTEGNPWRGLSWKERGGGGRGPSVQH